MTTPKGRPRTRGCYENNVYCTVCKKWYPRTEVVERCPKCNQLVRDRPRARARREAYDEP